MMSPHRSIRHGLTLAGRSLTKIRHSPDQLLDVVMLPITFVLMFVFLFGNSVSGDWRSYLQYVLPGIAVQALMFASLGTAVGLNTDLRGGVFDRFRSLPIARSAPLVGHVLGDLVKYVISLVIVFGFGSALGFRFHGGPERIAAGVGLILLFAFAVCWIATLIGLTSRNADGVQAFSIVIILPLTFGSNVFVPTGQLPGWLQAWVKINPVTPLADAARGLMLDQPVGTTPVRSVLSSLAIVAIFAPLSIWRYSRLSGSRRPSAATSTSVSSAATAMSAPSAPSASAASGDSAAALADGAVSASGDRAAAASSGDRSAAGR